MNEKNYITDSSLFPSRDTHISADNFRQLFDYSPLPLWVLNINQKKIVAANEALAELYGCSVEDLSDQCPSYFCGDSKRKEWMETLNLSWSPIGNVEKLGEWQHVKKNGSPLKVDLQCRSVTYREEPCQLFAVEDLSSKVNLEEKNRVLKEQLQKQHEDYVQFTHIVSHDLREPLRTIGSYLQLLKRNQGEPIDSTLVSFSHYAMEATLSMHQTMDALLEYVKVTGTYMLPMRTDCNHLVEDVVKDIQFRVKESNAKIDFSQLPVVLANSFQLKHLFQNLICNALKFRSESEPLIQISAVLTQNQWLFKVKDNGIGIDMRHAEDIFSVFKRLHNSLPGTGIGLAICKRIVEQHGGCIWVESQPNKGCTFYFTIPEKH